MPRASPWCSPECATSATNLKIIVVGAGIVGLATAWWLAQDGHAVTVIDRAPGPGLGTSFANGAQLSYSYVAPMASPATLRALPGYLLSGSSPVRFRPSRDPAQWRWLVGFLRACNADAAALGTAKLLALSFHSRDMLAAMLARTPVQFHHRRNGKLVVFSSEAGMAGAVAQMRLQATMGCEQQALNADEVLDIEPALAPIAHRLTGGILTPSDEVGDCHMLCLGLRDALAAPPFGVKFNFATELLGFDTDGSRIVRLRTGAGALEADLYVLAAGLASGGFGLRVPLQPIRGYSITVPLAGGNAGPVRSITDIARKTVYAPLGAAIRVAGFAEIDGRGAAIRHDRIATLAKNLDATFPRACDLGQIEPWAGLRPATPTDVPVIGRSRLSNLMLNCGHGSLGFTLAAGSGRLLADLVAGREPVVVSEHYALSR